MSGSLSAFLGVSGIAISVVTTVYLYRSLRQESQAFEGSIIEHFQTIEPFYLVSGALLVVFFLSTGFSRVLEYSVAGLPLVDLVFIGLSLVWFYYARQVFLNLENLGEDYFEGDVSD